MEIGNVLDEKTLQEKTLDWAGTASRYDRFEFLKSLLNCFKPEEMKPLDNLFTNTKHRLKRKNLPHVSKSKRSKSPENCAQSSVEESSEYIQLSPECSNTEPGPWFSDEMIAKTRAIDVEFVTLSKKVNGKGVQKAASVTIVDYHGTVLYRAKVKYERKDIIITHCSKLINGLDYADLYTKDCKAFHVVKEEIKSELKDKLVITLAGYGDFSSLDLEIGDFTIFDLQQYYVLWKGTSIEGNPIKQSLSLATIYNYYYKKNLNAEVHSDTEDALATMQIFREQYIPLKQVEKDRNMTTDDDFNLLKDFKILPTRLNYLKEMENKEKKINKNTEPLAGPSQQQKQQSSQTLKKKTKPQQLDSSNINNYLSSEEDGDDEYYSRNGKGFRPG